MKDDMVANSKTADPEFNEETTVKERPVILSSTEVKGILAGGGSRLRRPVRLNDRASDAPASQEVPSVHTKVLREDNQWVWEVTVSKGP